MRALAPCFLASVLVTGTILAAPPATPTPSSDHVAYPPKFHDQALKEIGEKNEAAAAARDAETAKIREAQKVKREAATQKETELRFDMSGIVKPAGPQAFRQAFHFPPQAQYLTGTCWSFSGTSFYESEVYRLTGQKIKLSEIWTVYFECVEKMRRYVRERGDSLIAEGSESSAFQHVWPVYGIVPGAAYPGVLSPDGRHDHSALVAELQSLGAWVKQEELWDEELVIRMSRAILDKHLGAPPEKVTWEGTTYSPKEFLATVLKLKMTDYVELMSTLSVPFYTTAEYSVPDNWWHDASYHNVPLDVWYGVVKKAIEGGHTVAIGGDVSEPGLFGPENAAVIPSFDIPQDHINQDSREFRIYNHTTEDDHGIHLVGIAQAGGHDWFLIKDSGRSSRRGKFEGYYFYRDDFVRLKMLTATVHVDVVKDLLTKFK